MTVMTEGSPAIFQAQQLCFICSSTQCASVLSLHFPNQFGVSQQVHTDNALIVLLLQLYGFHKTTQDADVCEFQHKYFRRDRPEVRYFCGGRERVPNQCVARFFVVKSSFPQKLHALKSQILPVADAQCMGASD
jgi:hypothetical protein